MIDSEYWTMREIGALFEVSSHKIGRALKAIGLRTGEGRPSRAAFEDEYVRQRWTEDGAHYLWAWHAKKTITVLEKHGLTRVQAVPQEQ